MRRLHMWLFSQWCVDLLIHVVSIFWYMLCRCFDTCCVDILIHVVSIFWYMLCRSFDTCCVDLLIHGVSMFWYMLSARIRTNNFLSPQSRQLPYDFPILNCLYVQNPIDVDCCYALNTTSHILFGKLMLASGWFFFFKFTNL
jgi:hypothetical protein